ncbi:MAG: ABC transporter permease [Candidatus Nanopelagicaceae bacterium]|jgi:peptide/nickel transport system permease protein
MTVELDSTIGRMIRRRGAYANSSTKFKVGSCIGALLVLLAAGNQLFGSAGEVDIASKRLPPLTDGHLLGTDHLGRDLLSRLLASMGWSFSIALLAAVISLTIGTTVGVLAASSTKIGRTILTRYIDLSISFPELILAVTIIAVIGRGFLPLTLTLGFVSWPHLARVVYAQTLGLWTREFVLAAKLSGVRPMRIILSHILPGLRNTLLVMFAFIFADLLVAESGLSFLGIGALLGDPSLGNMLADGRRFIFSSSLLMLLPCIAVILAVTSANLIGDGLSSRSKNATR